MRGNGILELRERYGWTQKELAEMVNEALGRKSSANEISKWERAVKDTPPDIDKFLDSVALAKGMPPIVEPAPDVPLPPEDTAPAGPSTPPLGPQVPIGDTRGIYARTCTELWESVAVGVGSVGALLGSQALMIDGQIIEQDKRELGRVWGQLAETNETFRKMLTGLSTGGAGLQVALVTGTTLGKMVQNHQQIKMQMRATQEANGTYSDTGEQTVSAFT